MLPELHTFFLEDDMQVIEDILNKAIKDGRQEVLEFVKKTVYPRYLAYKNDQWYLLRVDPDLIKFFDSI